MRLRTDPERFSCGMAKSHPDFSHRALFPLTLTLSLGERFPRANSRIAPLNRPARNFLPLLCEVEERAGVRRRSGNRGLHSMFDVPGFMGREFLWRIRG